VKMTPEEIWKRVLAFSIQFPDWAKPMTESRAGDLIQREELSIESKPLDASYIEFLKKQIELEPRGPEWTEILRRRMFALEPHVGKEITTLLLLSEGRSLTIKADIEGGVLISIEEN